MSHATPARPITISLSEGAVSGLLQEVENPTHGFAMAHGAGAGMRHPFLEAVARRLANHRLATLRYQFPYMEAGRKRTDAPDVAQATVRAAVALLAELLPGVPLLAGGKSFGGRMTSQAQAMSPLPGVRGLVFLGFPLHPPGKPGVERAGHLARIEVPMLFVQGTRDEFARLDLITEVTGGLGSRAALELIEGADHSFNVRKSSGQTVDQVLDGFCATIARWVSSLAPPPGRS